MLGRMNRWKDEKPKSIIQHIIDAAHEISMGRGRDSGIIVSPYVASFFENGIMLDDVSSEEYKKQQKIRHQQEIRNAAEEWK